MSLSPRELEILELAKALEPPAGFEERVLGRLASSIATGVSAPASAPAQAAPAQVASGVVTVKTAAIVATSALVAGLGAGVMAGRTFFQPPPPAPAAVESVPAVQISEALVAPMTPDSVEPSQPPPPVFEAPAAPVTPDPVEPELKPMSSVREAPRPKPATTTPAIVPEPRRDAHNAGADEALGQERELLETARSALLYGDARGALKALQAHAERFDAGRLAEERDSLWVQALVQAGEHGAARAKATQFHQRYPSSLFGPTVDAALEER